MPQLVQTIDAIAREKGRDVLFLRFEKDKGASRGARVQAIEWLKSQCVVFQECYELQPKGTIQAPYEGSIYLNVPYDRSNPEYLRVESHFENPDGSMKIPGVTLMLCTLELARHHGDGVE